MASRERTPRPLVQPYDFLRPDKLSKDQLRTLALMHENAARLLTSALATILRLPVQVHLASVSQTSSDEALRRLRAPTILAVVAAPPLPGRLVLGVGRPLALTLLDRLLGGEGTPGERDAEPSDLELALLDTPFSMVLGVLQEIWAPVVALELRIEQTALSPQLVQRALGGDAVALCLFQVRLREASGPLALAYPYATLEPVVGQLHVQRWFAHGAPAAGREDGRLHQRVEDLPLAVRAILGRARLPLDDLRRLAPGDLVVLETRRGQEIPLLVNGQPLLLGQPGTFGGVYAVRVTRASHEAAPPASPADPAAEQPAPTPLEVEA